MCWCWDMERPKLLNQKLDLDSLFSIFIVPLDQFFPLIPIFGWSLVKSIELRAQNVSFHRYKSLKNMSPCSSRRSLNSICCTLTHSNLALQIPKGKFVIIRNSTALTSKIRLSVDWILQRPLKALLYTILRIPLWDYGTDRPIVSSSCLQSLHSHLENYQWLVPWLPHEGSSDCAFAVVTNHTNR